MFGEWHPRTSESLHPRLVAPLVMAMYGSIRSRKRTRPAFYLRSKTGCNRFELHKVMTILGTAYPGRLEHCLP